MDYKTLEERLGVPDEKDRVIDVETDLLREVAIASMKLKKLQRDRAFLEKTLQATVEEIKATGSFHVLSRTVLQEILVQMEEKDLIEQEERNSEEVKYLQAKIVEEAKEIHDKLYQRDEIIAKLKDQMQDVMFDSEMQLRYVDHWERARQSQNLLKYNLQERHLTEAIEELEGQSSTEVKVGEAVERYINESQNKLLQEIDDWHHRYITELEERQLHISKLTEQREQHFQELEDLAVLYQKHQEEIRDYLEFVAERERKAAEEIFINMTATRIQAWWRGTMVRRGLGPYRKKKSKGKEKDAKGKKGKK
ncbi:dynein regulatory complex protein 9 isoform X1 [Schistocerca americana]|uniref:dynein regulatory complex protein 9 isoform X1 n=2 Tax=Schistocerca americana TaxID=7009 RepID=UPI001F5009D7|nr:dynein regulatory complex protein 9 isoform X1 [Schistocerca americana]XP_047108628.1 dynein regulatory complex protein 9 isoform X1 [Schistocerca piceifrons]